MNKVAGEYFEEYCIVYSCVYLTGPYFQFKRTLHISGISSGDWRREDSPAYRETVLYSKKGM